MYNIGDFVNIPSKNINGKICRINNEKYTIYYNGKYIVCNANDIIPSKKMLTENLDKSSSSFNINYIFNKDTKDNYVPEVMLRHLTKDEAIVKLDKFISDSICAKEKYVKIIHGKNGGVLKKEVWDYLRNSPFVKDFRLGGYFEGQFGVTIVNLKY